MIFIRANPITFNVFEIHESGSIINIFILIPKFSSIEIIWYFALNQTPLYAIVNLPSFINPNYSFLSCTNSYLALGNPIFLFVHWIHCNINTIHSPRYTYQTQILSICSKHFPLLIYYFRITLFLYTQQTLG